MVKRTLFQALEKAKLLAYVGLCRPHVEYAAAVVWDPNLKYITHDIEMVQHNAVRFISRLKCRSSITSALESLNLETLAARHGKTRRSLLFELLANEENHNNSLVVS